MAIPSRFEGDLYISGALSARSFTAPNGSITDAAIQPNAGIQSTKLEHEHRPIISQSGTATTQTRVIHVCRGAVGSIAAFVAGSLAKAVGDSTVTVDLQKSSGGAAFASVLTAAITLDSANADRVAEAGSIADEDLAAGDILQVVITATVGTGTLPTGLFAALSVREAGQ